MPVAAGLEQHMGLNLSELIAKHRELSGKLEALVASLENDADTGLSQLDAQLTDNLERILTAPLLSETDLRARIEFISEQIRFNTEGLLSLDRELDILNRDYESIIGLYRHKNAANNDNG